MWTYGLQLWGNAKKTNEILLRSITNAPPYVSIYSLHTYLNIKTIHAEAVTFKKDSITEFHIILIP